MGDQKFSQIERWIDLEMASALLGPLCQRVISPVYDESQLVNNVTEEIKKLRFTVSLIQRVLQDAEDKQVENPAVGSWVISLRQVLYDAEDVLDEVATDAALLHTTTDVVGSTSLVSRMAEVCNLICTCCMNQFSNSRNIAHQIKHVRMKLDEIVKEKDRFGHLRILGEKYHPEASRPRRRLDSSSVLADESIIIGRNVEKERIVQWLLGFGEESKLPTSSKKNIHVLTLEGMGGIGKTTLAKLVCNDPVVKSHFQPIIWVCVSDDFDPIRITRDIVDDVLRTCGEMDSNLNQVQKRLQVLTQGKRFLLVLDDVWLEYKDLSKWESLCEPLKLGTKESKIIITTRDQKVTEMVKGTPIFLTGLSKENLWLIFERYAFDGCDSNKQMQLQSLGRRIVEKLKGSPLAAKVIGRLLKANLDVKYWKKLMENESSSLPRDAAEDITPILKLSYDHLSGHLKQCFAYCSLFPKDHQFSKEELLPLWMAQGFVQRRDGFLAEHVGSEHFDDLVYKSFFEKDSEDCFVMHDVLHDLSELVSRDDCFRLDQDNTHKEFSEKTRHVSLASSNFDLVKLKELCKFGNLRTLLFLEFPRFDLTPHLNELFMMLKRLRALRLSNCDIRELSESIGSLKHLRLLDISCNYQIRELPESLGNLYNLQVLNLEACSRLKTLPSNMSALINLRHLYTDKWHRHELFSSIGAGLGKLTALQEVSVKGSRMRGVLTKMRMLRQLEIRGLEEVQSKEEAIQVRLCDMEHLEKLTLEWDNYRDNDLKNARILDDEDVVDALQPPVETITQLTINGYRGVRSPRWLDDRSWLSSSFLLERVELKNCRSWEVLPPLGQLHCLKYLEIRGMDKVRMLSGMPELEDWEGVPQPRQMVRPLPFLRRLSMAYCPMLRQLPPLPPTLTRLDIRGVGLTRLPGWMPSPSSSSSSSSSSSPALSSLTIGDCPNLSSLSDGLLHLLGDLTISNCPELLHLVEAATPSPSSLPSSSPPAVMATNLETFRIYRSSPQQINVWLLQCPSLQSLEIISCPELIRDFDGDSGRELEVALLHLAPSLRTLRFLNCENLVSLPPKLRHLSCLEELHLDLCPRVQCLPVAGLPESLEVLRIYRCGAGLKERCQEGGPDWLLISHIPLLDV